MTTTEVCPILSWPQPVPPGPVSPACHFIMASSCNKLCLLLVLTWRALRICWHFQTLLDAPWDRWGCRRVQGPFSGSPCSCCNSSLWLLAKHRDSLSGLWQPQAIPQSEYKAISLPNPPHIETHISHLPRPIRNFILSFPRRAGTQLVGEPFLFPPPWLIELYIPSTYYRSRRAKINNGNDSGKNPFQFSKLLEWNAEWGFSYCHRILAAASNLEQ